MATRLPEDYYFLPVLSLLLFLTWPRTVTSLPFWTLVYSGILLYLRPAASFAIAIFAAPARG